MSKRSQRRPRWMQSSVWRPGARPRRSRSAGRPAEALALGRAAFDYGPSLGLRHGAIKDGFRLACEAALALGDQDGLRQLTEAVDAIPPGLLAPSTKATRERMHAHLDASDGLLEAAASRFRVAAQIFEE